MQAEITFSGNTVATKAVSFPKIFKTIHPLKRFQRLVEEGDWDERLLGYEKYINRFSWIVIIASAIFLAPVCRNIFVR